MVKIIESLRKTIKSSFILDSFHSTLGLGLAKVFQLLTTILITNSLGPALFGDFSYIKVTLVSFAFFGVFGMNLSTTKKIASVQSHVCDKGNYAVAALLLATVLSLLACIFLSLFLGPLFPTNNLMFGLALLIIPAYSLNSVAQGILSGLGMFRRIAYVNLITNMAILGLTYIFIWDYKILIAISGMLLVSAIPALFFISDVFKNINYNGHALSLKSLKNTFNYTLPYAMQDMISPIYSWLLTLNIIHFFGSSELGLYSANSSITTILLFVPGVLRQVMLKHLTNVDHLAYNIILRRSIVINSLLVVIPSVILIVFREHLGLVFGQGFSSLKHLVYPSIVIVLISSISNVYYQVFQSMDLEWRLFYIRLTKDVLSILIIYTLLFTNVIMKLESLLWLTALMHLFQLIALHLLKGKLR